MPNDIRTVSRSGRTVQSVGRNAKSSQYKSAQLAGASDSRQMDQHKRRVSQEVSKRSARGVGDGLGQPQVPIDTNEAIAGR